MDSLGKNLKQIRKSRGLSQKEVAFNCDMDEQNYRRIENGKTNPTLKSLHRIGEALSVSVTELLST
ncbi:MAG TPA: helix-turn-helix transcriptional regulator [Crocinitomicaceae bacterium]|nr:helix-turn-helix transcriptional regulator [Crocinitomicaceae bacterium]